MSLSNRFDDFKNHLSRNRGKYAAAGAIGGTLGTINLAGNGYLGTAAQDTVHDTLYPVAQNLKINSIKNGVQANLDPYVDVYKKTDNILNNEENAKLLSTEQVLQKENIPMYASGIGEKLVSNLAGLTPNEKLNYALRNPSEGIAYKSEEFRAPLTGVHQSLSDLIN